MALTVNDMRAEAEEGLAEEFYSDIPKRMLPAFFDYLLYGKKPGNFLLSLFENNLAIAVMMADEENERCLRQWAMLVYNYTPSGCNGSRIRVEKWMLSRQDQMKDTEK
tara:strand:+ start:12604 stop:12927 length:324 start_codon:yes stop_codon:yes gene_type:complete